MRPDIIETIAASPRQHTAEWYKTRLGHFTGSQVGRLMKKGRGSDWSADAITYIKEVAAERLINPTVLAIPELFDQYLDVTVASSKAMAWGTDNENKALAAYKKVTGRNVELCGSLPHPAVLNFYDSPDGVCLDDDGVVEIKCPLPKNHAQYLMGVKSADDLLAMKPEYYWQCIAHMSVTGASWCDWMSYCPFLVPALHIVTIKSDEGEIGKLLARIGEADTLAQIEIAKALAARVDTSS